jgi:putative membrane protein
MKSDRVFAPGELEEIARRVGRAEGGTRGEIVPYVVDASDDYPEAYWTAAALGALLAPLAAWALHAGLGLWGGPWGLWMTLPPLAGAGAGWLAVRLAEPLRRALAPGDELERRVRLRAAAAFVDEEVFDTRDRSGILLFVSLFEHRVLVVADAGIEAKVAQAEWDSIAGNVAAGIRAGRAGEALAEGVTRCGELLARRDGLAPRPDDADELSDHVRRETR